MPRLTSLLRPAIGIALAALVGLGWTGRAAAALKPTEAIAALNQQRAAAGIPAGITENPNWSQACALHNRYMAKTGEFGHDENPNSPYYTKDGAWAGHNSVLSPRSAWDSNPFETAPIHLAQLLAPQLEVMGVSGADGFICATTWPGYTRPDPSSPQAYSYPGDGATGVRFSEYAAELPFTPGDFVGLPGGTKTGPYVTVYVNVPSSLAGKVKLESASISGPDGPVALRSIDSNHDQLGSYLPYYTAFLIPTKPLEPRSTYRVATTFSNPTLTHEFSFTTATSTGSSSGVSPQLKKAQQRGRAVRLVYAASDGGFDLTAMQGSKKVKRHVDGAGVVRTELRLRPGWWMLLARGAIGGTDCRGILVERSKGGHGAGAARWSRLKVRHC